MVMIYKLLSQLKVNYKHKKKFFFTTYNIKKLNLIKILIKYNLIKFTQKKKKKLLIYLKYSNNNSIFNFKNLYRISNKKYIKYKELLKITKLNNEIYIISTSKGFLNNIESINHKIGGIILFKIFI